MFRTISIAGFVVTFVGIAVCCAVFPCRKQCRWSPIEVLRRLVHLFTLLFLEQKLSPPGVLRKLVYLLALLCFVVLAITGFYPSLVQGQLISGYFIMVHTTAGGVFAVCLAVLAVMWAHNCRFNKDDWPWLQYLLRRKTPDENPPVEKSWLGQKICFWLIVSLTILLILSIVLSMFPFFGTDWQELLLSTHRYIALLLALVIIVHTYLLIRTQMKE